MNQNCKGVSEEWEPEISGSVLRSVVAETFEASLAYIGGIIGYAEGGMVGDRVRKIIRIYVEK